jgi:hypothetical protein
MSPVPLTPTELDALLATLHARGPDAPQWQLEPPQAGDRSMILCGPGGIRVLIETAWNTPERLRIAGLLPASPEGYPSLPCSPLTPALTVARTRGPRALASAILRRLLPTYQPLLQAAQARAHAHHDAVARQAAGVTLLAHIPGCTAQHAPGQVGICGMGPEASAVRGQATVTLEGDVTLTLRGLSPQAVCTLLTALHLTPYNGQGEGVCHDAHR